MSFSVASFDAIDSVSFMPHGLSIPRLEGGRCGKRPIARMAGSATWEKELAIVFIRRPVDTRQGLAENIGLGWAEREAVVRIGLLPGDETQFKPRSARR